MFAQDERQVLRPIESISDVEFQEGSLVFNHKDRLQSSSEVSELLVIKRPDEANLDETDTHLLERLFINAQDFKGSEQARIRGA